MAQLTDEQKQAVSQWAEGGATLNDIQSRLKSEFGVSMTYMEARLLVVDLEVRLKDKTVKPEPKPAEPEVMPAADELDDEPDFAPAALENDPQVEEPAAAGAVPFAMSADELVVPGALVSGTATFSDGMKAKWYLDQMGRLSLKADQPGYQPPQADVPKFQQGLEKILAKMGLY